MAASGPIRQTTRLLMRVSLEMGLNIVLFLIQQATDFTVLQAFLWPLAFACDHFTGTASCSPVAGLVPPPG